MEMSKLEALLADYVSHCDALCLDEEGDLDTIHAGWYGKNWISQRDDLKEEAASLADVEWNLVLALRDCVGWLKLGAALGDSPSVLASIKRAESAIAAASVQS